MIIIMISFQRFIRVLTTCIAGAALRCNEYVPRVEHYVIPITRTSPKGGHGGE